MLNKPIPYVPMIWFDLVQIAVIFKVCELCNYKLTNNDKNPHPNEKQQIQISMNTYKSHKWKPAHLLNLLTSLPSETAIPIPLPPSPTPL